MKSIQPNKVLRSMIFIFLGSIIACNNSKNNSEKTETTSISAGRFPFDKLVGTWQMKDANSFERWSKNNDGTYQSLAFTIKENDTSWNEKANIYPESDYWVFENTVKGQNDGKAIKFVSSLINENIVQFSNPAHDFPTDVNYTLVGPDNVKAFIVGPNHKGGKDTISFNYIRVK